VFHYREDRIRAHVPLCWLALLLVRVIQNATEDTWRNVRHQLDRMALVTGHWAQPRRATLPARAGHQATSPRSTCLNPPRYFDVTTTSRSQVSPRRAPVVTRPVRPSVDGTLKMTPAQQGGLQASSQHRYTSWVVCLTLAEVRADGSC
jgi:hypothetical protein